MLTIPEWLASSEPDLLYRQIDGIRCQSRMGGSSSTGGFYAGPCLDNPKSREYAGKFLCALAQRYKDHPAMLGYDIWNECNYAENICCCPYTLKVYQQWLERKYGNIQTLNKIWHRYSYTNFSQIGPPPELSLYPESIDWIEFRKENFYEQMQWRIDTIRSIDSKNLITAHGTADTMSVKACVRGHDDWLAASKVQIYGYTFVPSRRGNEAWKAFHAGDLTRCASEEKSFWHAETQGGPLWLQPQVWGRSRHDGRISSPSDIRQWNLTSVMCGARGLLNPRWRPLLDGPLFGAFGAYGMDGSRTPQSQMASQMAKWFNDPKQRDLLQAFPIRGEIGILYIPEAQIASQLISKEGEVDLYPKAMKGSYKGFFDNNIQADYVHIKDINKYDFLYMPFPIMIENDHAKSLMKWVEQGGTLISESCPAYFTEGCTVGLHQPAQQFYKLFGAEQENVEFMPDLMHNFYFTMGNQKVYGGGFLQTYRCIEAQPYGRTLDGQVIAVKNQFGKGRVFLLGACPSIYYLDYENEENRKFFAQILSFGNKLALLSSSNSGVIARMQVKGKKRYLWILNTNKSEKSVVIRLSQTSKKFIPGPSLRDGIIRPLNGYEVQAIVPAQDAVIFEMLPSE